MHCAEQCQGQAGHGFALVTGQAGPRSWLRSSAVGNSIFSIVVNMTIKLRSLKAACIGVITASARNSAEVGHLRGHSRCHRYPHPCNRFCLIAHQSASLWGSQHHCQAFGAGPDWFWCKSCHSSKPHPTQKQQGSHIVCKTSRQDSSCCFWVSARAGADVCAFFRTVTETFAFCPATCC